MTSRVTPGWSLARTLILGARPTPSMHCEFCASSLPETDPENLALLQHIARRPACNEQYGFLIENLNTSWTRNMSGG